MLIMISPNFDNEYVTLINEIKNIFDKKNKNK